jgi:ABC-2 type transport system ATP-binding protein
MSGENNSAIGQTRIKLERVAKIFGAVRAVNNISFNVSVGEVLGVMGPNGAGKTTTMRMIAGFLRPSAGEITLDGVNVSDKPQRAKKLLGYLPEGAPLWQDMSPLYLLRFAARARGFSVKEGARAIDKAMELADLKDVATQPIATLSKGFRRRVGLAQAIFHDPPILVLDEPTDGLDPNQKRHVRALIRSMAETKAIIISTHILEEVEPLCTRVLIMHKGFILADETPAAFAARSNYHNAVSVRVARHGYQKLVELCENSKAIRGSEVSIKVNEAQITFFPQANYDGEKIAQDIRQQAAKQKLILRSLAVESGRLDDVFYNMTHSKKMKKDKLNS